MSKRLCKSLIKSHFSTSKPFKFSSEHAQFYKENGYLVIPSLVSNDLIDQLRVQTSHLIDDYQLKDHLTVFDRNDERGPDFIHTGDKIHFFLETGALDDKTQKLKVDKQHAFNKIGHAMHDLDPIFHKFSYRESFKSILQGLGYQTPTLCQSMYIFKSPRIGQQVQPHTDNTYLITHPSSCIGLWVALDDAKKSNGCLWGVPGSHKQKTTLFFKRNKEATKTYTEDFDPKKEKSYDISKGVALEVTKGSVVVLHGDFVHYSDDNLSELRRHAYTMHFVEMNGVSWDKGNWLQRNEKLPFKDYYKEI